MRRELNIEELNTDNTINVHIINIEDGNPRGGWYWQMLSFNGFIDRAIKRFCEKWVGIGRHLCRFDRYSLSGSKIRETITHDSVWDFYDYINYDYKNKKKSYIDKHLIIEVD